MFVPLFVQINELSDRPRFKSIPALPGRLTIGAPQLKLRDSRSSPGVPARFSGAISLIGQLSSCIGGGADGPIFDAKAAETGGAISGAPGLIRRASLRLGKLGPGGPCVNCTLGFSADVPIGPRKIGRLGRIKPKQTIKQIARRMDTTPVK